jgi:peptide chain release factor subunit 1
MASDEEQSQQRARYEFKRILEDLEDVRGRGTELVSLYLTPDKNIRDARQQISSEIGEAQNIKSKSTRKNVIAALETIEGALKNYKQTPENGLVFLVGHKSAKGDTTEMVKHVFEPPQPVPVNLYRCDNTFHLDPLEGMVEDADAYGLVVIDRSEASIGVLRGEHVETLRHTQSMVPSKHTAGGQSQQRFERLIEEAAQEFYKQVAEQVNELLWKRRDKEIQGLLVGGPGRTKDEWLKTDNLHHELDKKLVDTFDTGYADEYGLSELVDQAHDTLEQRGLTREKDLMDRFLAEVRQEGGKFSYGEDQVRQRLQMGAVETLLLSESLRRVRADLECPDCEHELERTTDEPDAFRHDPPTCPECGNAQLEIVHETDVVDELTELAGQRGTDVEIISEQSEQGQMLMNAFGGVAAILRFRVS